MWLFFWVAFLVALGLMPPLGRLFCALVLFVGAWVGGKRRGRRLILRARWLLVTIVAVMAWTTPGEFLPGWLGGLGLTREGVVLALDQAAYLIAILSSLVLLQCRLGNQGLISGLYRLAAPLPFRDALAVRLLLVLAEAEKPRRWQDWLQTDDEAGESTVRLQAAPLSWPDRFLITVIGLAVIAMMGMR